MSDPFQKQDNGRSSLFEKLPPDLRKAVDAAIIERVPSTYQGVWLQFELGKKGVSFTAFYRYARRLRDRANLTELAALSSDEEKNLEEPIRKLVSRRLVELLLHTEDEICVKEISKLISAQHQAARIAQNDRRLAEQARLAEKRLSFDRSRLVLAAQSLKIARRRFANPLNPPHRRRLPQLDGDATAVGENDPKVVPHLPDRDHESRRQPQPNENR